MYYRATLRSFFNWRASSEFGANGFDRRAMSLSGNCRCLINSKNNYNHRSGKCFGVFSNRMLPTFEERVFQINKQQTRRKKSSAHDQQGNIVTNGHAKELQYKTEQEIQSKYEEAISALNTLQSNADTIRRSIVQPNNPSNVEKFLKRSGISLDQLDKLSIIHVSGTKGKGSTCALTESILRAFRVRTGFFSSPHLVSVTERIRIDGVPISKEKFTKAFWKVYERLHAAREQEDDMPAYFQFLTILSFHIFIEEKVDVIILEVGIGGELDSTNVVRNTKVVGITSLGLEHTMLLGNTLEEIAWQKAGIIKPGSHVYTSVTQPQCLEVIRQRAGEKKATLHIVPEFEKYCQDLNYKTLLSSLNNVTRLNGSLAIQLSYEWMRQHKNGFKRDFLINETRLTDTVVNGLVNCNWPGRCQLVKFLNFNVHLDGAHTVESMQVCSDWFSKITENSSLPKVLIFNTTGDRDSKKLMEILRHKSQFDFVCFVPNVVSSNSSSRNDIATSTGFAEQIKRAKMHSGNWYLLCNEVSEVDNSRVFDSILDGLNYVQKLYENDQKIDVLVTGSIHLLGATILALNEYKQNLNFKT